MSRNLIALCIVSLLSGCQLSEGELAEVRVKSIRNGLLTFGLVPNPSSEESKQEFYCNYNGKTDFGFVNRQHGIRYHAAIRKDADGGLKSCKLTEQADQALTVALKQYQKDIFSFGPL
ncbi:hypothetical protein ACFOEE_02270 [Pseudoalteromonas fenneropenaei]|uniref:Lipoprotein n=1 Tax=Pseudoalteromonas fenneropenaei TaxID=1737459 RepID=A0ABV7CFJ0_9GAMM